MRFEPVAAGGEVLVGDFIDDQAVLDDVVAVGDLGGEPHVLLDQQDREARLLKAAQDEPICSTSTGAMPSGRFVEQQQLRPGSQQPADREHLLLAARQFVALASPALLQVGKQIEDLCDRHAARLTTGGSPRFSSTVRLAKMPRSSGQ